MATTTFAADVLTITDNNSGNFISTGIEFLTAALPTQVAYLASLGNLATATQVDVFGNGGADTIVLDDFLIEVSPGVQGASYFVDAGNGADAVFGSRYGDTIYGGNGNDYIEGRCGNDLLYGGEGRDTIYGGKGNDTIYGDAGNDFLYGDEGNDTLFGGEGNDRLDGGAGNDILHGGEGNDVMTGGAGADVFMFSSDSSAETDELDRITDWNRGRDQIDLTGVVGLSAVEVYVTGASRAEMLLLNNQGDVISTIDIQATNAGGRNILLQDSAYGTGDNARIKVSGGETLILPDSVVVL